MDKQSIHKNTGFPSKGTVGCVIVNYNTPEIISRAVNSIKDFVDEVLIVDGSDIDSPSYFECDELDLFNGNVNVVHVNYNIGHGKGLNKGIEYLRTDYVICMDSDAVLNDPTVIEEMIEALKDGVYGCGKVVQTDENGRNKPDGIDYLHPYFCMFKRSTFNLHHPFINHGAPFIRTMNQINGKLKNIEIPDIDTRVWHEHRATRNVAGNSWLKDWDKVN